MYWISLLRKYFTPIGEFLRGAWLLDILKVVFRLAGQLIRMLSRLLEGEGGFLWVLFFLSLMITILTSTGGG